MTELKFNRFLIAKYSPKNGCHSVDGSVLLLIPPLKLPPKAAAYHFIGASDGKKNKYGWVEELNYAMCIEDFLYKIDAIDCSEEFVQTQVKFLKALESINLGSSVAVDFIKRGVPPKMELIVHKVLFYGRAYDEI